MWAIWQQSQHRQPETHLRQRGVARTTRQLLVLPMVEEVVPIPLRLLERRAHPLPHR
jgi:hypothetical protein